MQGTSASTAILALANSGEVDGDLSRKALVGALYANLIQVPTPYSESDTVVFTKHPPFPVTGWDSLKPYRIVLMRGYKIAEQKTQNFRTVPVTSPEQLFYFLAKDRADVAVYNATAGRIYIKWFELQPPLEKEAIYHFLHKKHAGLVPKIDAVIKAMVKGGESLFLRKLLWASLPNKRQKSRDR